MLRDHQIAAGGGRSTRALFKEAPVTYLGLRSRSGSKLTGIKGKFIRIFFVGPRYNPVAILSEPLYLG